MSIVSHLLASEAEAAKEFLLNQSASDPDPEFDQNEHPENPNRIDHGADLIVRFNPSNRVQFCHRPFQAKKSRDLVFQYFNNPATRLQTPRD